MSMALPTCDSCTRTATGLCDHDNPVCEVCDCDCETTPGLAIDIDADGTTTVDYTPPTSERCGRCGQVPDGWAYIGDTRYCHGGEVPTCYQIACFDPSAYRRTPAVRDALHLVGLDLPREA